VVRIEPGAEVGDRLEPHPRVIVDRHVIKLPATADPSEGTGAAC
jgi:hypothetical protein